MRPSFGSVDFTYLPTTTLEKTNLFASEILHVRAEWNPVFIGSSVL